MAKTKDLRKIWATRERNGRNYIPIMENCGIIGFDSSEIRLREEIRKNKYLIFGDIIDELRKLGEYLENKLTAGEDDFVKCFEIGGLGR